MKKKTLFLLTMASVLALQSPIAVFAEDSAQTAVSEDILTTDETTGLFEASFDNKDVYNFINRMYDKVLDRTCDPGGLRMWYNNLTNGTSSGADIAYGFFFSHEMLEKNLSDDAYVELLYSALFDRGSDAAGKEHWMDILDCGMSRLYVCSQFIGSSEFQELCSRYHIQAGQLSSEEARDQNESLTRFVNRLYDICLSRPGDVDGINNWTSLLLSGEQSGSDIAYGFLFSQEFLSNNYNNEEYVHYLYAALFDRYPDEGRMTWTNALNSGLSRRYVLSGFVGSSEWIELCSSYGIEAGSIDLTELYDLHPELTELIQTLYTTALCREPSGDEKNSYISDLLNQNITGRELVEAFMFSDEYQNRNTDNRTFVSDMFLCALNRNGSDQDYADMTASLDQGTSRLDLANTFLDSDEFMDRCDTLGILKIRDGFITRNGETYYYSNGEIQTGWQTLNGATYYFNPDGGAMYTGWNELDGYQFYFGDDGRRVEDLQTVIGLQPEYLIRVYKPGNYIIVFVKYGNDDYVVPYKKMICSCGNNTPTGTYYSPMKFRWLTMVGGSQAQWCTQILGDYLFHSVPYQIADPTTLYTDIMYNFLGTTQSLGCIRLQAGDAKWIYDNCSLGTEIYIDPYNAEGPFDKPLFEPLPSWHTWDPTDPTINYLCQERGCHNI